MLLSIKKILSLVVLLFIVTACEKNIHEEFEKPTIEILSANVLSDNKCEIELKITLGVGAKINDAYILLTDISEENSDPIEHKISITNEKEQIQKVTLTVTTRKHDYKIKAYLLSEKNVYASAPEIIRFSGKLIQNGIDYIELYTPDNEYLYIDETNKIALHKKQGELFSFIIYYSKLPSNTTKTEIKLNGTIPIQTEITYSGWSENGNVQGFGYLPKDIQPGIYNVHIYIDDVEYILDYRINVLPVKVERIPIQIPIYPNTYEQIDRDNYFIIGNKIYYIYFQGVDEHYFYLVHYLDLNTMQWVRKNDIPYENGQIYPQKIVTGNRIFIIQGTNSNGYENSTFYLSEYKSEEDTFMQITKYPGRAVRDFTAFAIGENIYMGAGLFSNYGNGDNTNEIYEVSDFWKYNLNTQQWTKLNDVPYRGYPNSNYVMSSCSDGNKAYIITCTRQLWEYNPADDHWRQLEPIKSGAYNRAHGNLMFHNGKLYLTSDTYNPSFFQTDVWEYNIKESSWRLINIPDCTSVFMYGYGVPSFFHNDDLYIGYSYPPYSDTPILYKLTIIK